MALIICIETTIDTGSIALGKNGKCIALKENAHRNSHAGWIHTAIEEMLEEAGVPLQKIDAIAVSAGPGSYTGIRVGIATAKGLSFALNLPLIEENTLKIMSRKLQAENNTDVYYCPMIDARRMEVFTAVYDENLQEKMSPAALILDETSYSEFLNEKLVIFFGSGAEKFKKLVKHKNAKFSGSTHSAADLVPVAEEKFLNGGFASLAYSGAQYVKEFYDVGKANKKQI